MIKTIIIRAIIIFASLFIALIIYSMEQENKDGKPFSELSIIGKIFRIFYDIFLILLTIVVILLMIAIPIAVIFGIFIIIT